MKKEEEKYLNELIEEANKEFTLDRKLAKEVAIKFAKWLKEKQMKILQNKMESTF